MVLKEYDVICNKVRYLKSLKSGITYVISHNYAKIRIEPYNALAQEKTLSFHNAIILMFQTHVCKGCHDGLLMSLNLGNIALLDSYGVDVSIAEFAKVRP